MSAENREIRTFSNETGSAQMDIYTLFPGVRLIYNEVQMDRFDVGFPARGNLIEIIHCQEGRIEQEFEDEFFYLMPGELSIAIRSEEVKEFSFPLRSYRGITVLIETETAPGRFSEFLEEVGVRPLETARRLCGGRGSRVFRARPHIEHVFSELYAIPEEIRMSYLKVKFLELMVLLGGAAPETDQGVERPLSRYQVQLAKAAAAYLEEHMDRHITILELARQFNVSDTYLKTAFKGVYGVPVYSYIRTQKMKLAARLLAQTDRTVADIAAECGYTNSGKFSSAFREVMGELPSEYRWKHPSPPGQP